MSVSYSYLSILPLDYCFIVNLTLLPAKVITLEFLFFLHGSLDENIRSSSVN